MTAPRDGHGPREALHYIDIDMSAFPPAALFDERAAVLAFIDAATTAPLLPSLRDKLADLLIERMQADHFFDPWRGTLDGVQPRGLLSAFAPGYPYKPRHKPRRPPRVRR